MHKPIQGDTARAPYNLEFMCVAKAFWKVYVVPHWTPPVFRCHGLAARHDDSARDRDSGVDVFTLIEFPKHGTVSGP